MEIASPNNALRHQNNFERVFSVGKSETAINLNYCKVDNYRGVTFIKAAFCHNRKKGIVCYISEGINKYRRFDTLRECKSFIDLYVAFNKLTSIREG